MKQQQDDIRVNICCVGMPLSKGLFVGICLLAEVDLHLLCADNAKLYAQSALKLRPEHTLPKAIIAKVLSLSEDSQDWEKALSLASEVKLF